MVHKQLMQYIVHTNKKRMDLVELIERNQKKKQD